VYGATSRGFTVWWLGTVFETPKGNASAGVIANSVVWNQNDAAYFAYETSNLTINGFTVLGDANEVRFDQFEHTAGIELGDYMTRGMIVENINIQDEATGVSIPTNVGRKTTPGTFTLENSYLDNVTNIEVPLLWSSNRGTGLANRIVNILNIQFAHPAVINSSVTASNIKMDTFELYDPTFYNFTATTAVQVTNYNNVAGDNFLAFFTYNAPSSATKRAGIDGLITPN
jgi:hypothetical protein